VSGYQKVTAMNTVAMSAGTVLSATAVCPNGTLVLGGGVMQQTPNATPSASLMASYPDTDHSWLGVFKNSNGFQIGNVTITVYAICATVN
jgi:hypothetical protein